MICDDTKKRGLIQYFFLAKNVCCGNVTTRQTKNWVAFFFFFFCGQSKQRTAVDDKADS